MNFGAIVEKPAAPGGAAGRGDDKPPAAAAGAAAPRIAGLSTLKGLVLYGAVLIFAGLYVYFVVKISTARPGTPPPLDGTLTAAAAALAGVLGSAFALEIGTTTDASATNQPLSHAIDGARTSRKKVLVRVWQALSIDSSDVDSASWPKTFGIWIYALVGSAVAVTYVFNQNETPAEIKALAVAFGGYVLALVNSAYRNAG